MDAGVQNCPYDGKEESDNIYILGYLTFEENPSKLPQMLISACRVICILRCCVFQH